MTFHYRERCELQVKEFMNNSELAIIGTNIDEFKEDINIIISSRVVPKDHNEIYKFSKRRSPFNHPTVMYKKSVLNSVGLYKDLKRGQDYDLFVRILMNNYKTKNINKSLLLYRVNNENINRKRNFDNYCDSIKRTFSFYRIKHSSLLDLIIVTLAQTLFFILPLKTYKLLVIKTLRRSV
jgi:hypothetical protein